MRGSFKTLVPVEKEPLPLAVRQEIHEVIRLGYSLVGVERRGAGWRVRFSGQRSMSSIIGSETCEEDSAA